MSSSSVNKDSKRFSQSHCENTVRKPCTEESEEKCHTAWPYYWPPEPLHPPCTFLPLWLFLQITVSASFSLECSEECHVNDHASREFFWLYHLMEAMRGHSAREKMSPTAVQSPAAFQHNRRRWLQPALSSNKTPRNQGRLENRFFSYANIKYQKIYAKKKKLTFSILWATTHTGRAKSFRS